MRGEELPPCPSPWDCCLPPPLPLLDIRRARASGEHGRRARRHAPDAELHAIAAEARQIWAPVLDIVIDLAAQPPPRPITKSIRLVVTERMLDVHESTGLGWIDFVGEQPQPTITVSVAAARRLLEPGRGAGEAFNAATARLAAVF